MGGFVYVLKCFDCSYYIGSTRCLKGRLAAHKAGKVKYTKSRLPAQLKFVKEFPSYKEAVAFEERAKSWKKRRSVEKMFEKEDNICKKFLES